MPKYQYKAVDQHGEVISSFVQAQDKDTAGRILFDDKLTPISISEAKEPKTKSSPWFFSQKLKQQDIENFTLELSTFLNTGLPIGVAINAMADLEHSPLLDDLIKDIQQQIRQGSELAAALSIHSTHFNQLYISMVRAGETSGTLANAFEKLSALQQSQRELKESVTSALIYPGILLSAAGVAIVIMLAFVVPQFSELFAGSDRAMPLITQVVIGAGHFLVNWGWALLAASLVGLIMGRRLYQTEQGRLSWDTRIYKTPLIGNLARDVEAARFFRTLATQLRSGIHLTTALKSAREVISNQYIARRIQTVEQGLIEGRDLSTPLNESGVIPPIAANLLALGEKSGNLGQMTEKAAELLEKNVRKHIKRLLGLLEPAIIVLVALIVGLIIFSVVLLILESNNLPF